MDQAISGLKDDVLATGGQPNRAGARTRPRIFYISPLAAGPLETWPALLDHAKALGFTHVLSAPPFAGASLFQPSDFGQAASALAWTGSARSALSRFASMCRERGLSPLLDVDLSKIGANGPLVGEYGALFARPDLGGTLDPRRFHGPHGSAPARFAEQPDGLAAFWSDWVRSWSEAGIAGFRLLLHDVPAAALRSTIAAIRRKAGDALLLGWTPGLSAYSLAELEGAGLDYVFSSLPWWDFDADWLWAEAGRLARIAPAIAAVEAPFGPRLVAHVSDPLVVPGLQRRIVSFASAFGDGWMMPMGFEQAATRALDDRLDAAEAPGVAPALGAAIRAANAATLHGTPRLVSGAASNPLVFLRAEHDLRAAGAATLTLVNVGLAHPLSVALAPFLAAADGRFQPVDGQEAADLPPGAAITLQLAPTKPIVAKPEPLAAAAERAARSGRVGIENVRPSVDDGSFPAKRVAGEVITVEADILCDGHDKLGVALQWRAVDEDDWQETRMRPLVNDRWAASFLLERMGRYLFRVEAWRDAFATFRDELQKKNTAGINVEVELIEGRRLVEEAGPALSKVSAGLKGAEVAAQVAVLLSAEVAALMATADARAGSIRTPVEYPVEADRREAVFASWYEVFPRSMSDDPNRHGTFADVERHLPRIRDMGFDVLYFPPIHPIGLTNRKGLNNSLKANPGDPGSPYAIGSEDGGHDALHPELGTLDDFQHLRAEAPNHGLELAIDFAIQCSPDHPWLKEHKDWFAWRPDGSMRYAENPPKKYEDIVNVDFYAEKAIPGLWVGLAEVVLFWAEQGVRIFRVDNPHTKPFPFWEWMIAEVRARFPDALFLAEAFTRPKIMNRLGKVGFSQSYTYFTWRNTRRELEDYLTELTTTDARDFFRPNFFVNTPDINPIFLQTSGRPGHLIRAALAATLSGLWGVYSGFELCEATPLPGREEYIDSEKYQIRAWDWDRPGNITAEITALNQLRRQNPALQTHLGVTFLPSDNEQVMFYEKATADRSNVVFVAVSLDPFGPQSANVELPLYRWSIPDSATVAVTEMVRGARFTWSGKWQNIALTPEAPFSIWRVRPGTI